MSVFNIIQALITFLFFRTPLHVDQTRIIEAEEPSFWFPRLSTLPVLIFVADSYSVGDRCYCLGLVGLSGANEIVETPHGFMTVGAACEQIGPGPGSIGRPFYNDPQCGNGPQTGENERSCPGRVDRGSKGCGVIGPEWNWNG